MTGSELRTLAGSVVMVGFRGLTAGPATRIHDQIRDLNLAGVILFDLDAETRQRPRNIAEPSQLRRLTDQLQQAASHRLLIAVDQEGGQVARLNPRSGFPAFPSHAEMREKLDSSETRLVASQMARILAEAGINLNFAPVVDLNINPQNPIIGSRGRSFSSDPGRVTDYARAFIAGHHQRDILTALKHFPGHGSSICDSHVTLTDITDTFNDAELLPYRRLLTDGVVDMVMVGHLLHRGYDARLPASLSSSWIEGLLRREMGFDGVVLTDDLDMAGVAETHSLQQRVALALNAGVDLLLFGNNLHYDQDRPDQVVEAVVSAVESGRISEDCLSLHASRVERLRASLVGR